MTRSVFRLDVRRDYQHTNPGYIARSAAAASSPSTRWARTGAEG